MVRLAEHDVEHSDLQDRLDMLLHRQQILAKMTARMLNSIESLTTTVRQVDEAGGGTSATTGMSASQIFNSLFLITSIFFDELLPSIYG